MCELGGGMGERVQLMREHSINVIILYELLDLWWDSITCSKGVAIWTIFEKVYNIAYSISGDSLALIILHEVLSYTCYTCVHRQYSI